uniref:JAB1/MPN/MOV34 metalloenzyme domain-containing protein n=1 Tax=Lactuca sativa TaxID=4236 RepID=A0A9R1XGB2_LACSA|nr:hypothetical protein LSAT_V11C400197170 [Lactuca sativa]
MIHTKNSIHTSNFSNSLFFRSPISDPTPIEIFNNFELLYDPSNHSFDRSFLEKKQHLYKKVFPNFYTLGWYSTGTDAEESDMHIHKALMDIYESPVYVLLNPLINHAQKDLPVNIYENELHVIDGITQLIFVRSNYTIEVLPPLHGYLLEPHPLIGLTGLLGRMFEEELNKGNGYIKEQTTDKEAERKLKRKRCLLKEDAKADKRGILQLMFIVKKMVAIVAKDSQKVPSDMQVGWMETAEEIDDLFIGDVEVWRRACIGRGHVDPTGGDFPVKCWRPQLTCIADREKNTLYLVMFLFWLLSILSLNMLCHWQKDQGIGIRRNEYYAWGLHRIAKAVSFLNNDCNLVHGNVCLESEVATPTLDLKLHAFDALSEFDGNNELSTGPMLAARDVGALKEAKDKLEK